MRFVFFLEFVFGDFLRDGDKDFDFVDGEYGFFKEFFVLFDVSNGLVLVFLIGVVVVVFDVRLFVGLVVGRVMGFGVGFILFFCVLLIFFMFFVLFRVCLVF